MKKISILLSIMVLSLGASNLNASTTDLTISSVSDQAKSISGKVTDEIGAPIVGATVIIKGTSNGAVTAAEGDFSIPNVQNGEVIEVNFLGYKTYTFTATGSQSNYTVILTPDQLVAEEVVVTAMGIERKAKSLTYATQNIGNDEFSTAKDVNMINALQGKSAGLVITPNSTGAGGSSKILMRGNKSVGNNQPLIVVDGIPMNNPTTTQIEGEYAGRDGGDALSNINPDDIKSINLLKGASAAALYGSMAANGVLMISTKKGAEGTVRVTYSSNLTLETELLGPKIQKTYGAPQAANGGLETMSWGAKLSAEEAAKGSNRLDDYYRMGTTYINSISISGGTEKVQNYLSYANTFAKGVTQTNQFNRHNLTLRETFNLFNNKLTIDASMNYIKQTIYNKQGGGTYFNPLPGLYTMPNNADYNYYANNYEVYDPITSRYKQNWYTDVHQDFSANPSWVLNRNSMKDNRNRILASGRAVYRITDWIDVQGRLSYERTSDEFERKYYGGSSLVLVPKNGRYAVSKVNYDQFYGDAMVNFHKDFGKWEIKASLGTSFMQQKSNTNGFDSDKKGLFFENIFLPENVDGSTMTSSNSNRRLNSVFATVQVGFNSFIYLDVTGRNDWSSTLAYTKNNSYFYPSAGISLLINEIADLGKVNLLKVRGSYTVVGNDVAPYITHPLNTIVDGKIILNNVAPFNELKPEKLYSMEFGFDFAAFNNKFTADFTFYKTNNKNQLFTINAPSGTGYDNYQINAGDIENQGVEFTAAYLYEINRNWSWKTSINMSYNKNTIKKLDDRLPSRVQIGGLPGTQFVLKEGGSFGDIYAQKLVRDDKGVIQLTDEGTPKKSSEYEKVGNVNGDYFIGWGNNFQYKEWNLSFLIDGRIGGKVVSMTEAYLDKYGVSERSGIARDNGGVDLGDGTKIDTRVYYNTVGGREGATDQYIYNATNFRLRELTLGYTFRNLFGNYTGLSIDVVARNLFFIYKDSPKDPDTSMSTHNGYQGVDVFSLPSTRNFGLKVQFNF